MDLHGAAVVGAGASLSAGFRFFVSSHLFYVINPTLYSVGVSNEMWSLMRKINI